MLLLTAYDGSVTPIPFKRDGFPAVTFKSTAAQAIGPWNTVRRAAFQIFYAKFSGAR
jgi:hypothetical protein